MCELQTVYEKCDHKLEKCKERDSLPTQQTLNVSVNCYLNSRRCEGMGRSLTHFANTETPLNIPVDDIAQTHVSTSVFVEGGGTFCCLLLILIIMIFLLVQILMWRILDIDMFPVDDSMSNHELSNTSIHRLDKMEKLP